MYSIDIIFFCLVFMQLLIILRPGERCNAPIFVPARSWIGDGSVASLTLPDDLTFSINSSDDEDEVADRILLDANMGFSSGPEPKSELTQRVKDHNEYGGLADSHRNDQIPYDRLVEDARWLEQAILQRIAMLSS